MIATVAKHQLVVLHRQRALTMVVGTLLGVTVLAGMLGWASRQTIVGVYDESVKLLDARGLGAPPNPFLLKPTLALLSNMVIYITMIGALVALVLGHLAVTEEETNGIGRLVFSRRVARTEYVAGKVSAAGLVLGASMFGSATVSVAALWIANRSLPSLGDVGRLSVFFGLSWLYLMLFALIGMTTLLITKRRSLGLSSAIGVWLVVTFAVPQFTSGLRPSQSLNPVVDPISTSQAFFKITRRARPFSPAEQFKEASARILHTGGSGSIGEAVVRVVPILVLAVVFLALTASVVWRHDFSRSDPGE